MTIIEKKKTYKSRALIRILYIVKAIPYANKIVSETFAKNQD
jgi:hypothetical protein